MGVVLSLQAVDESRMEHARPTPRISVVTTSLNQAQYLPQALESVFTQRYPDLEYIVMDGGSTDGSVAVIERVAEQIAFWVSEPDDGQSAAINQGLGRARGDILTWLNSDDAFLPGTLALAARMLDPAKAQILHGDTIHVYEDGRKPYTTRMARSRHRLSLGWTATVIQPGSFFTRKAWEMTGPLDETLHYSMDWEWFFRAERAGVEFIAWDEPLSIYRMHDEQKTIADDPRRIEELRQLYRRLHGERGEHLYLATRGSRRGMMMRAMLKLNRSRRLEGPIVRACFPGLSLHYDPAEIESTVRML
jgi:glycosyltransferase involved in cell wall biosynthesis